MAESCSWPSDQARGGKQLGSPVFWFDSKAVVTRFTLGASAWTTGLRSTSATFDAPAFRYEIGLTKAEGKPKDPLKDSKAALSGAEKPC